MADGRRNRGIGRIIEANVRFLRLIAGDSKKSCIFAGVYLVYVEELRQIASPI